MVAVLCASLGLLSLGASSALANRTFDSKVTPFQYPGSVSFDGAGNLWVSDSAGIYKYNSYPSQTLLATPDTSVAPPFGGSLGIQLAVDQSNGEVFVAQYNGRSVAIFTPNSESNPCPSPQTICYSRQWTSINGVGGSDPGIHVAIDNTNTFSRGRVYLSLAHPENDVEALDAAQRPVDFPATASYIHENKLTGTPSGPFGDVQNISVDSNGNIYVTDTADLVVDEFDSTGTFLRTFPDPQASDGNPGTGGVGVDPTNGNVLIVGNGPVAEFDSSGNHLENLTQDASGSLQGQGTPAVNSNGYFYVGSTGNQGSNQIDVYTPNKVLANVTYKPVSGPTTTSGTLEATIDPNGGGDVTECHFDYGTTTAYSLGPVPCSPDPNSSPPGSNFSSPTDVSALISGLSTETTYHYRVVVVSANGTKYGADQTYAPHNVLGLRTDPATNVAAGEATLNGTLIGDGTSTHYYFEWGRTPAYGNTTATPPGIDAGSPSGPDSTPLSFDLNGLAPYTSYHYRVVAINAAGTSKGEDQMFTTAPGVPSSTGAAATAVHADRAVFHGQVNPNGADTTVHFEYVDDATFQQTGWANAVAAPTPGISIGMSKQFQNASTFVDGLTAGTLYDYRIVATNEAGSGADAATFRTFGFTPSFTDPCPNAHVRQQTGAALLLDCRAYELVSAANAGGYDVESNLVASQTPFGGYPNAENPSQVLYGVDNGGIPGTGDPTNKGVDPYVATRDANTGWSTRYVGIPANNPYASGPFASTLAGADAGLDSFAFAGPDICSPCFAEGSQGIPIHNPDGTLTQGMVGLIPVTDPVSAGVVKKPFSGDGSHFIFGSEQQFEPQGNPNNGNLTIYSRDLKSAATEVASTNTSGTALADGQNVAELDVSNNGQRLVIGDLVNTDSAGNHYYHLYMHVAGNPNSIDLTPGTPDGALYDGMSSDGTKVYFTTTDVPTGASDADTSADIYRADVTGSEATLTRVSTGAGASGDTNSCNPAANTVRTHWNSVGPAPNCDAVAVGGGGGVASGDGSIYFLSPELLDGGSNGVQNAPNLYIARPGSAPHFVRTLESSANAPLPPPTHPYRRSFSASFGNPAGVAIDHASGDTYVFDIGTGAGTGYVYKFDPSGQIVQSFGTSGKLTVGGVLGIYNTPNGIAVDNDPGSPNYGDLYVPDLQDGIVKKFSSSGVHLADIKTGSSSTAVGVDPANGNVYVAEGFFGSSIDVYDTSGNPVTSFPTLTSPTGVSVDSSGNAYVVNGGGFFGAAGTTEKYDSSGTDLGQLDSSRSNGVAVDPSNDHVYVDEGNRVVEFDSAGNPTGAPTGSGLISGSTGVAADSGSLDISNHDALNVASYGPAVIPPEPSTDNPLVLDSVGAAGTRYTADFQVSPSGNDAAFTSTLPLSGYDSAAHREIFRYDAPSGTLDCVSCNPTGEQAIGDATLASNGLSLSDDGRVFFNSTEGLVDRDLNSKMDAYEWEKAAGAQEGTIELISTGASPLDSSLLGASADGTDAYFFTHDTLVAADNNGDRVKIYDARAGGGFSQVPPVIQCQASDECHGAGSPTPPAPPVRSITGTGGNRFPSPTCRAGYLKKHGKCVRKRKHQTSRKHHHRGHRHG